MLTAEIPSRSNQAMAVRNIHYITVVEVEDLFGLYTYRLEEKASSSNPSRLFILYGDNGSGKTTILKLIFNLLSGADNQGHRTFLARTPFLRLSVLLDDGSLITAQRDSGQLLGAYRIIIQRRRKKILEIPVAVNEDNIVKIDDQDAEKWAQLIAEMSSFNLALYYLSDDRRTRTSLYSAGYDAPEFSEEYIYESIGRQVRRARKKDEDPGERVLNLALRRVEDWFRDQAIRGSSEGEANVNTIYSDIVRRIARARGSKVKVDDKGIDSLNEALGEIELRSRAFSSYGLMSPLELREVVDGLAASGGETRQIMFNVLTPYMNGLKARLDALQRLKEIIEIFVGSVNSFFTNKDVVFTVADGIRIVARNGQLLAPPMLSSGERQILLLFCNVITARGQASVFIIDEPEISLNIKWQRRLIDALLLCAKDSAVQFIIATHSVELLAQHKASVVRLVDHSGHSRLQHG
jgi:predicted ATPase